MAAASILAPPARAQPGATALRHPIALADGRKFELSLPRGFQVSVVAEGLRRPRFFARAPDRRIVVTDLNVVIDNRKGAVIFLDGLGDDGSGNAKPVHYLENLRNPNSVAFYRDGQGADWLYIATTDGLMRYAYKAGDSEPSGPPHKIAQFPGQGQAYKEGGWHVTRTLAFSPAGKLYVSIGSSCNVCEEIEPQRAAILEMDPDGGNVRIYARGLRNAVGLKWVGTRLIATVMGADHLGDQLPSDTMVAVTAGMDYGWPYCYHRGASVEVDPLYSRPQGCRGVPRPLASFAAHSSPLGFAHFPPDQHDHPALADSFLVALQGSSRKTLRRGYRIVRIDAKGAVSDFMTGLLSDDLTIHGKPCDIMPVGRNALLVSDERAGAIYLIAPQR